MLELQWVSGLPTILHRGSTPMAFALQLPSMAVRPVAMGREADMPQVFTMAMMEIMEGRVTLAGVDSDSGCKCAV